MPEITITTNYPLKDALKMLTRKGLEESNSLEMKRESVPSSMVGFFVTGLSGHVDNVGIKLPLDGDEKPIKMTSFSWEIRWDSDKNPEKKTHVNAKFTEKGNQGRSLKYALVSGSQIGDGGNAYMAAVLSLTDAAGWDHEVVERIKKNEELTQEKRDTAISAMEAEGTEAIRKRWLGIV